MSSGYPGEFIRGGGGGGGAVRPPTIGGNQTYGFRQQQQQQQGGMMMLQDQIDQRRADLLMGKRSFGDYQSYQQLLSLQQQMQQQQQQQQPVSYLQLQQQLQQQQQQQQQRQQQQSTQQHMSMLLRNQSLMRSVKQRTSPVDLSSLTNNNNNNNINMLNHNNNNSNNNSLTRFGVPVYQQPRQQQIPFINNNQLNQTSSYTQLNPYNNININNQIIPTTFPISSNNNYSQVINPVQTGVFVPPVQPDIEDQKIFNTLQELEKQLLDDDDDDNDNDEYSVANTLENDAVSGVTNSEWSETFQSLMSPNPSPSPSPLPANNNVVSPSPTSSTSSCCSTSAPATTVSPKQLMADVAAAISDGKNDLAAEMLAKLSLVSNCDGSSEQRLAYYMSHALRCRVDNVHAAPVAELFGGDQVSSVYSLYDISPCFKFGLLAANLVMLEAITGAIHEGLKIHIIDFDVGHGAQYVNLLRALAERRTRVPCLGMKITIVETALGGGGGGVETGGVKDALVGLADRLGVSLKYECVTRAIHELTRESLGCEEGEAVVVNFAFKLYRVPDESVSVDNLRDELLRRVKGLSPRAVTLVEQDMNGNGAPFMTRVSEVCEYYGALFDSLEATLGRDNVDRCRVEKGLGRKMVNSVACEGKERVERAEVFGKWRARMGMAGFQLKALSHTVAESMRAKLDLARGGNPGFTVKEENGGVGFGWMGRNLTVASAWR